MTSDCAALERELSLLRAEVAAIPRVNEQRIIQSTRSALQPDINTAVAGGIAVVTTKLQPQIDNGISKAREALTRVFGVETNLNNVQREALKASTDALRAQRDAAEAARMANGASSTASKADIAAHEASSAAGTSTRVANNAFDEAIQAKNRGLTAERTAANSLDIARKASLESALAKGVANQADLKAGGAVNRVTTVEATVSGVAAKASRTASEVLTLGSEVSGFKGVIEGFKGQLGRLGNAVASAEKLAGDALVKAANAVGISSEALGATARLAGKIVEIFNIIATFAVLFEQLATLSVLGGRIDAVERAVEAIGASVSSILGKLLGLQGRIARNELSISDVRGVAEVARTLAISADSSAGTAQVTASRAEGYATTAQAKAIQAQTTADGAVRNASQANVNATIAYQKAVQTETTMEDFKRKLNDLTGKATLALTTALTAISLYQGLKALKGIQGIPGIPGRQGERGLQGIPGVPGKDGITTVVTLPGVPGKPGRDGINGRNGLQGATGRQGIQGVQGLRGLPGIKGKDGIDVNPSDIAGLKAFIAAQHTATRTNINITSTGLVAGVKTFFTSQLAALTALITAIATNTYIEKVLSVLTFAATMHNALMLSNNLAQTLGTIIDQILGFILPKGIDGTPINIGEVLGKASHQIIADAIGEANYTKITEDWAKANRIYQATQNVFNSVTNAVATIQAGMEMVGGNIGKIGNALKIWGVIGEKAYGWMNPQPNFHGRFFTFLTTAEASASTIASVVSVPLSVKAAVDDVNSSRDALQTSLTQEDPKDKDGHPLTDTSGNPLKYEPGTTIPTPTKTALAEDQAKADSTNIIQATLEDLFDGGD